MLIVLLVLVALLAFANGANDNSKGVATLVGFGSARPREALAWATVTTAAGSAVSFWLAGGLIKSFSTGLFAAGTLEMSFFVAVVVGAFAWVILATWTGMPVSTTHAIMGGLIGAGLVRFGGASVKWSELGARFAVPLALSPVLSMLIVYAIAWPVVYFVRRHGEKCVCVVESANVGMAGAGAAAATAGAAVVVDTATACESQPVVAKVTASAGATAVHWLSSGMVGFARGWNDAPKIAALAVGALAMAGVRQGTGLAFFLVTVAMAIGGITAGRKVLETLGKKLTPLPLAESLTASIVTAGLVGMASWVALPVSTTHVSTGAIIGAGLKNDRRQVRWGKVGEIVLSWVITLPVAAAIAAAVAWVVR